MNLRKTLFLLIIISTLCGCALRAKRPETAPPDSRTLYERLIQQIDLSPISTLTASMRISIFSDEQHRGTFRGYLFYKKNKGLFSRIIGPLGMTVADALLKEDLFEVYISSKKTVYYTYNQISDSIFPDRHKIDKSPHQIRMSSQTIELSVLNTLKGSNEHSRLYVFDRKTLTWKALRIYMKNQKIITVEITNQKNRIPVGLSVRFGRYYIKISLRNIKINQSIKDGLFIRSYKCRRLPLDILLKQL